MKTISDFSISRINNFDFIRFIAATAVVFSHSWPVVTGSNETEPFNILTSGQNTIGGIAVCAFFILSGFLVTQSFTNTKSINYYLLSRALRIFPALVFMVLCCVLILGPITTSITFKDYFSSGKTISYLGNMVAYTKQSTLPGVFAHNPFPNTVNGSLWSLPYEILFYILVPAIGFLITKKILPAFGFLAVAIALVLSGFLVTDYLFDMANYFLCGSLYYSFRKYIPLNGWMAFTCVLLLILSVKFHLLNSLLGILGGYILFYAAYKLNFGFNNFAHYGDFSYGIYIWAFPVQQLLESIDPVKSPVQNFLVSFPFILALAIFSWHTIEKKSLEIKSYNYRDRTP